MNGFSRTELFKLVTPDYEAGTLTRNELPASEFQTFRAYKTWMARFCGKRADREDSNGYMVVSFGVKRLYAHRVLWFMRTAELPDEIDHKNGVTSDNSESNLRNVTHDKNLENGKTRKNSTTGETGVHYYKSRNKWTAHITKHGKTKSLGYFDTREDAHAARKIAEFEINFERYQ